MNLLSKRYVTKLFEQKASYVDSALENLKLSNEMAGRFQTLIATIILAQLAFLGTLGFSHGQKLLTAIAITVLVSSLLVFLIAVSWQQVGVLKAAKYYFKQAGKLGEYIKETKQSEVEELPEDLRIDENVLSYTKWSNRLLLLGYTVSAVGTATLIYLVWKLALGQS